MEISIQVNDNRQLVSPDTSLSELLKQNNIKDLRGIAVAVNGEVISGTSLDKHMLAENDQVLIITASQGG